MRKLTFRWMVFTVVAALLLGACGGQKPPPDLSSANIIELVLGLINGETHHASEPYVITTPSGAIIPAPAPGAEFTVAVGTDNVTIVQAHKGSVKVYAADTWRTVKAGMQTVIQPGAAPSTPTSIIPLSRDSYLEQPRLGGG